jgi:hypothetical protein
MFFTQRFTNVKLIDVLRPNRKMKHFKNIVVKKNNLILQWKKSVKECFKNVKSLYFQCNASNANFLLDAIAKINAIFQCNATIQKQAKLKFPFQ